MYQNWYVFYNIVISLFPQPLRSLSMSTMLTNFRQSSLWKQPMVQQPWKENVFFLIRAFSSYRTSSATLEELLWVISNGLKILVMYVQAACKENGNKKPRKISLMSFKKLLAYQMKDLIVVLCCRAHSVCRSLRNNVNGHWRSNCNGLS